LTFDEEVNQVFQDHLPFILGGLAATAACIYPCAIVSLFLNRMNFGESYAYLIFADLVAILLAIFVGIIVLAWIPLYVVGVRTKKET
jgi:hypothetical protein